MGCFVTAEPNNRRIVALLFSTNNKINAVHTRVRVKVMLLPIDHLFLCPVMVIL